MTTLCDSAAVRIRPSGIGQVLPTPGTDPLGAHLDYFRIGDHPRSDLIQHCECYGNAQVRLTTRLF
jgi:hypothetical protein